MLDACLPELPVDAVEYLAEGWDSTVFTVNGELVFRFPKRADVAAQLRRELRLLPAPIPRFLYESTSCAASSWARLARAPRGSRSPHMAGQMTRRCCAGQRSKIN